MKTEPVASKTRKPIILIVDSNVLFTKNDVEVINSEFLEKLEQCRAFARIQLCIPRICLAEIISQKSAFADSQLAHAERALRNINQLTDTIIPKVGTYKFVSRALTRKILKWCNTNGVLIAKVPVSEIKWKQLIEAAG